MAASSWNNRLEELTAFFKMHGHYNVPFSKQSLAVWVMEQRRSYRKIPGSTPLSQDQLTRLESIGFPTKQEEEDRWDILFEELQEYQQNHHEKTKNPNSSSTNSGIIKNRELAAWVTSQRKMYKRGTLQRGRLVKLQSIAGIDVTIDNIPHDPAWEEKYRSLKAFHLKHGHYIIPYMEGKKYAPTKELSAWAITQQSRIDPERMKTSTNLRPMSQEEFDKLEEIGFEWTPDKNLMEVWNINFHKLEKFRAERGHCAVPSDYKDQELAIWITRQRKLYECKEIKLDRLFKLEELGFLWDLKDYEFARVDVTNETEVWMFMYRKLCRFEKVKRHTAVPEVYDEDWSLGAWVAILRKCYQEETLQKNHEKLLDKIGFDWSVEPRLHVFATPRSDEARLWDTMYDKLEEYKAYYGHCKVPDDYCDQQLVHWIASQRGSQQRGSMEKSRKELLDSIGLSWQLNNDTTKVLKKKKSKKAVVEVAAGGLQKLGEPALARRRSSGSDIDNLLPEETEVPSSVKKGNILDIVKWKLSNRKPSAQELLGSRKRKPAISRSSNAKVEQKTTTEDSEARLAAADGGAKKVLADTEKSTSGLDDMEQHTTKTENGAVSEGDMSRNNPKASDTEQTASKDILNRPIDDQGGNGDAKPAVEQTKAGNGIKSKSQIPTQEGSNGTVETQSARAESTGDSKSGPSAPESSMKGTVDEKSVPSTTGGASVEKASGGDDGEKKQPASQKKEVKANAEKTQLLSDESHGSAEEISSATEDSVRALIDEDDDCLKASSSGSKKSNAAELPETASPTQTGKPVRKPPSDATPLKRNTSKASVEKKQSASTGSGQSLHDTSATVDDPAAPRNGDASSSVKTITKVVETTNVTEVLEAQNLPAGHQPRGQESIEKKPIGGESAMSGEDPRDDVTVKEATSQEPSNSPSNAPGSGGKSHTVKETSSVFDETNGPLHKGDKVSLVLQASVQGDGPSSGERRGSPTANSTEEQIAMGGKEAIVQTSAKGHATSHDQDRMETTPAGLETPISVGQDQKKRGRPRKASTEQTKEALDPDAVSFVAPKKRGRPRKSPVAKVEATEAPDVYSVVKSRKRRKPMTEEPSDPDIRSFDGARKRGRPRKSSASQGAADLEAVAGPRKRGRPKLSSTAMEDTPAPADVVQPRKRGRPKKSTTTQTEEIPVAVVVGVAEPKKRGRPKKVPTTQAEEIPVAVAVDVVEPKKRGRPKKSTTSQVEEIPASASDVVDAVKPKKRGRPKKSPTAEPPAPSPDSVDAVEPKKRGRPKKSSTTQVEESSASAPDVVATEPKKRGRPKKSSATSVQTPVPDVSRNIAPRNCGRPKKFLDEETSSPSVSSPPEKKKRGRPRKSAVAEVGETPTSDAPTFVEAKKRGRPRKSSTTHVEETPPPDPVVAAPKKRGRPKKSPAPQGEEPLASDFVAPVEPRKRGRPKKSSSSQMEETLSPDAAPVAMPRKRGRPKKASAPDGVRRKRGRPKKSREGVSPESLASSPLTPKKKRGRPKKSLAAKVQGPPGAQSSNLAEQNFDVGSRVAVYWTDDDEYFPGEVTRVDSRGRRVFVEYDDGDVEWAHLGTTKIWLVQKTSKTPPVEPSQKRKREAQLEEAPAKKARKRSASLPKEPESNEAPAKKARRRSNPLPKEPEPNEAPAKSEGKKVSKFHNDFQIGSWVAVHLEGDGSCHEGEVIEFNKKGNRVLVQYTNGDEAWIEISCSRITVMEEKTKAAAQKQKKGQPKQPRGRYEDDDDVKEAPKQAPKDVDADVLSSGNESDFSEVESASDNDDVLEVCNIGDKVEVYWSDDEEYYPGEVTYVAREKNRVFVEYDDGDEEWLAMDRTKIRRRSFSRIANPDLDDVVEGSRVSVWWPKEKRFFEADVKKEHGLKFFLKYDDGDSEWTFLGKRMFKLLS